MSPAESAPGDDGSSIAATVPGCVHVDLLAAGRIPDPFLDANELDVAWVADARLALPHDHQPDPMTTIASTSCSPGSTRSPRSPSTASRLAGRRTCIARTASTSAPLLAAPGEHELTVTFRSATRAADATREREGDWPSSSFDRPFNYVRKMACAWGWDWGPWLATAGIWRPATLHAWDAARLDSVRPVSRLVAGSDADHGAVTVTGAVERARDVVLTVDARLLDPHGVEVAATTTTIAPGRPRLPSRSRRRPGRALVAGRPRRPAAVQPRPPARQR